MFLPASRRIVWMQGDQGGLLAACDVLELSEDTNRELQKNHHEELLNQQRETELLTRNHEEEKRVSLLL